MSNGIEREAAYQAALTLVRQIDRHLVKKTRHYRTKAGRLLTTLDQVVRAILADDLQLEPVPVPVERSERSEEERWPQLSW